MHIYFRFGRQPCDIQTLQSLLNTNTESIKFPGGFFTPIWEQHCKLAGSSNQEKLISVLSALNIECFKKPEIQTKQKENENLILHRIITKQIENFPKNGTVKFGSHS